MRPKIVIVGSSNTDMVVHAERLPAPGETVLGGKFSMTAGGKGANQAVAAARLGAEVTFVARVGRDLFGEKALTGFKAESINTAYVVVDANEPSGVALIVVDRQAENLITVAPGANSTLSPADVAAAEAVIQTADGVLLQLEIPLETVQAAIELARQHHVRVILNPAPARALPLELLRLVDVLTPNEREALELTGSTYYRAEEVLQQLAALGPRDIIVTRGVQGCDLLIGGELQHVPAFIVQASDTTGAGDAFNGALAVALARGQVPHEAARYANATAALAVTRFGAQAAMPAEVEVQNFLQAHSMV